MYPGLKERLLGLINDPAYTPLKKEELALIFDIHPTEMPMFYNFLDELEEDGYIGKTKKGKIASPKSMGYFVGKFVAHRKVSDLLSQTKNTHKTYLYQQQILMELCTMIEL